MCNGKSNCTGADHSLPVTLAMLIVCVGITVHYIDQNFNLQQELLAFEPIEGQHTGQNLANIVFKTLEEYDIKTKFFCVTTDNASNNFTMAKELQKLLADEGEFLAGHILEGEFVAEAKGFSIDEEGVLSVFCLDGEIVAPGEQFLLHHVAHKG